MTSPAIQKSKSIAGSALVGLGIVLLHANLSAAIAWLNQVLTSTQSLRFVPAVMLAALQAVQAGAAGHPHLVRVLLQQTLLLLWPVLLVVAGTFLSRQALSDDFNPLPGKNC
jgi:hypothetical protein